MRDGRAQRGAVDEGRGDDAQRAEGLDEGLGGARVVFQQRHLQVRVAAHRERFDGVAAGADVLVIITEWDQFRALDLDRIKLLMKAPVLVDLRNIYRPEDMAAHGFVYESVGRPPEPRE